MSLDVAQTDGGYVLCVGLSLEACGEVARLVQDQAVVVAAADTDGARAILGHPAESPEPAAPVPTAFEQGPVRIDIAAREAIVGGTTLQLSPREFDLLATMSSEVGRVWSFAELTMRVWKTAYLGAPDVVTSAVKRLRKRLAAVSGLEVASVRGIGYRLVVSSPSAA
jgi:DNA-binding response OmpR family regulator